MALWFFISILPLIVIIFGVILYYGLREKSYEQALEEQRSKSNFDLLLSSSNVNSKPENSKKEIKKDKSKKVKENVSKKSKDKSNAITKSQLNKNAAAKEHNSAKVVTSVSSKSATQDIALVKTEPTSEPTVNETPTDVVDQEAPKLVAKESSTPPTKDTPKVVSTKLSAASGDSSNLVLPVSKTATEQPKVSKKSKKSVPKASKELSFEDILELVNSSYFTDEDITRLTDALLNRQAEDQKSDYNWQKKNDPLETLQKQLNEKKEIIEMQNKNLEAAKKKSEGLLTDLQVYKKRINKLELENDKLKKDAEVQKSNYIANLKELELKNKHKIEQGLKDIRLEERNRFAREVQNDCAKMNELINSQASALQEKEKRLEEVTQINQQLTDQNTVLEQKVSEKERQCENLLQQVESSNKQHELVKSQLMKLEEEKQRLDLQVQESLNANNADVENYQTEITDLKNKVNGLVENSEQLKNCNTELRKENDRLSRLSDELNTQLSSLRAQVDQLTIEKDDLLAKFNNVNSEKQSLTTQSNELNALIKSNDEKLEQLTSVYAKLGISVDQENFSKDIEKIKSRLNQMEELDSKYNTFNELIDQLNHENGVLEAQISSLKQENKDQTKKAQEYATTLLETEKILNDLQEKVIKNTNEQNKKLEELAQTLSEKNEELDIAKEELAKYRDNLENANKLNDKLTIQLRELKELVSEKETQIATFKSKEENLCESIVKIKEENKNLNNKIVKLNTLVQIGKDSYQEENKKVQNLESMMNSLMNGKDSSAAAAATSLSHTANGNQ